MDPYDPTAVEPTVPWLRDRHRRRVLIVDTCVLRNDVLRRARTAAGVPTRMVMGSGMGAVRVFAARHVVDEMDRDVRRFAAKAGLDAEAVETLWLDEYRPVVVAVDVSDLAEAMSSHPLVAPTVGRHQQDVPSAVLAAVLGQRVLSVDDDLVQVGTGRSWLQHVIAATDAGAGDRVIFASATAGEFTVHGAAAGARRAYTGARALGGTAFADCLSGALLLGAAALLIYGPTRRWIAETPPARALRRAAPEVAGQVAGMLLRGAEGDQYLRSEGVLDSGEVPLVAAIARLLASAPYPLSATEIAGALSVEVLATEAVLDGNTCFRPTDDDRWQLGGHVTRL